MSDILERGGTIFQIQSGGATDHEKGERGGGAFSLSGCCCYILHSSSTHAVHRYQRTHRLVSRARQSEGPEPQQLYKVRHRWQAGPSEEDIVHLAPDICHTTQEVHGVPFFG